MNKKLKSKEFHAVIAVEDSGNAFAFSVSTLSENAIFKSCRFIVDGINEEAKTLSDRFKVPTDTKLKKPVEFR